jgi:hypothetical protein
MCRAGRSRGGGRVSLDFILERLTSVQVGGFWALMQVITYALAIWLGLVILSKISDKRKGEGKR